MGMFDSILDDENNDWQTKAFECLLNEFRVGDPMPDAPFATYQVEVLGGDGHEFIDSYATVRDGVLATVDTTRDERLPLLDYFGGPSVATEGA